MVVGVDVAVVVAEVVGVVELQRVASATSTAVAPGDMFAVHVMPLLPLIRARPVLCTSSPAPTARILVPVFASTVRASSKTGVSDAPNGDSVAPNLPRVTTIVVERRTAASSVRSFKSRAAL